MSESQLRRQLEYLGYEPDEIEDVISQKADEYVDRIREERQEQQEKISP